MKGVNFFASLIIFCSSFVSNITSVDVSTSNFIAKSKNNLQFHNTLSIDLADVTRKLESLVSAASDEEMRKDAMAIFKVFKIVNPNLVKKGVSEEEQFEYFYTHEFQEMLKNSNGNPLPTPAGPSSTTSEPKTNPPPSPTTGTTSPPSSSTGTPNTTSPPSTQKPTPTKDEVTPSPTSGKYKAVSKSDSYEVGDNNLSFFNSVYDEKAAQRVRALKDNTNNMEAILQVQSNSDSAKNSVLSGPISLQPLGGPTSLSRRLDGSVPLEEVMFCDVTGNAIFKAEVTPPPKTEEPKVKDSTTTTTVIETIESDPTNPGQLCTTTTTIKATVTAYQSGCSRQNHPEGCDQVYYKGCGNIAVNPETNQILVARQGGRTLGAMRYQKTKSGTCQGQVIDVVSTYRGKKFNSPSYAEYSKKGHLYFTDSPFGFARTPEDLDDEEFLNSAPGRELPFNGVFVVKAPVDESAPPVVELCDCTMTRPNKIAFSVKEDKMYITNSKKGESYVKEFDIKSDGSVGDSRVFFNFTDHPELELGDGVAEGIKVDEDGHVFVAAGKAVYIFSEEGKLIGSLNSNQDVNDISIGTGRLFLVGGFGVVSQTNGMVPARPLPSAQTSC